MKKPLALAGLLSLLVIPTQVAGRPATDYQTPGMGLNAPGQQVRGPWADLQARKTPRPTATAVPTVAPTPSSVVTPTPSAVPTPVVTATATPTAIPTATPTVPPPTAGEIKYPRSPLTAGDMPEQGAYALGDAWDDLNVLLYQGYNDGDGINERFEAVADPVGSGRTVTQVVKVSSDAEMHSWAGTGRGTAAAAVSNGESECSAWTFLVRDATEFPLPSGIPNPWLLIGQHQQSGSPNVAVLVSDTEFDDDPYRDEYAFISRQGSGSDPDPDITHLLDIEYGRWAHFVFCLTVSDTAGWARAWAAYDAWPDVSQAPLVDRSGYDSYFGADGHDDIGLYGAQYAGQTFTGYIGGYGRSAGNPARAIELARGP